VSVYSVNRRRAILLLVLSSILLLTLDLRGNPFIDKARVGFAKILEPFQTAGDVIATPFKNAWHGATDYQRLEKANQDLQDELARERGDQLAARAIYGDYQDLLALNRLSTKYQTVTARVVGTAPGNFSQTVDIDKGSNDGIKVGMPVVNFAGLVGKITTVYSDRSVVLLVTDADYAIECKVSGSNQPVGAASTSTTVNTTPSGLTPDQLNPTTTTSTTTTLPTADTTVETSTSTTSTTIATGGTTGASTGVTSTTSSVPLVPRETGGCEGRGSGQLPAMRFVSENPVFGPIDIGAVVSTAGGSKSLAPPDIIIGEVVNKVERGESEGPLLEIKLAADLNHLSLVQVVQYNPTNG
jgi:rod shape-determining protein MreC